MLDLRRTTLAVLAAAATLGLAACGGDDEPGEQADRPLVQTATEPMPTAAETQTETAPARTQAETTETETTETEASGSADTAAGKQVFASTGCASCHTLADAGASGTVGPNLDETKPDEALVVDRVTNGQGGMPSFKGQLDEGQIQAVAAYIASVAGK